MDEKSNDVPIDEYSVLELPTERTWIIHLIEDYSTRTQVKCDPYTNVVLLKYIELTSSQ